MLTLSVLVYRKLYVCTVVQLWPLAAVHKYSYPSFFSVSVRAVQLNLAIHDRTTEFIQPTRPQLSTPSPSLSPSIKRVNHNEQYRLEPKQLHKRHTPTHLRPTGGSSETVTLSASIVAVSLPAGSHISITWGNWQDSPESLQPRLSSFSLLANSLCSNCVHETHMKHVCLSVYRQRA